MLSAGMGVSDISIRGWLRSDAGEPSKGADGAHGAPEGDDVVQQRAGLRGAPQRRQDGHVAEAHQHEAQVQELVLLAWRDALISRCLQQQGILLYCAVLMKCASPCKSEGKSCLPV